MLYAFLGKAAYWLTAPALFLVSLWSKPRVRVIVVNDEGNILLVRNWYGRQRWALPGGGRKWHEPPAQAGIRELREELSLDLSAEDLHPLGMIERYDASTPFSADLFVVDVPSSKHIFRHPFELIDHRWVAVDALPKPIHPSVEKSLKLWRGQR